MSNAWEKVKRASGTPGGPESTALDRDLFPELCCYLGGVPSEDGRSWKLWPHTMTLWVEGDLVFFCIQAKQEASKLFGSVKTLGAGFEAIEWALKEGQAHPRKNKDFRNA